MTRRHVYSIDGYPMHDSLEAAAADYATLNPDYRIPAAHVCSALEGRGQWCGRDGVDLFTQRWVTDRLEPTRIYRGRLFP